MITLYFEGGIHDGIEFDWPGDAASCPTAFEFEDHLYDRRPEEGMTGREALGVMFEARHLGVMAHRYEFDGMVVDDDGDERWAYVLAASRRLEAPDGDDAEPGDAPTCCAEARDHGAIRLAAGPDGDLAWMLVAGRGPEVGSIPVGSCPFCGARLPGA